MAIEGKDTFAFLLSNVFNWFMFIKSLLKITPIYTNFSLTIKISKSDVKIFA